MGKENLYHAHFRNAKGISECEKAPFF